MQWRYGESNPGPLACEASALPLSYIPERTKNGKNLSLYCLGQANGDWGLIRLHLTEELGRVVQNPGLVELVRNLNSDMKAYKEIVISTLVFGNSKRD